MISFSRTLTLDIFDYSGHKICGLYDNSSNVSGQAFNVFVTTERNGWKEQSFTIPSTCETEQGQVRNYRLGYQKADFSIRLIDDAGVDWFLISEPRVVHKAFSTNVEVTAGHISQLLKTKNLGLEFSDEEGNNVGTARELLETILSGSTWEPGLVDKFFEKDGESEKRRSQKASAKTGAFKLITEMCKLFDAKPVFHGDTRTVDIVPMNPFSEPIDGGMPDVSKADGVLELYYGQNISGITRTLNTENMVTKLYAYGSYGDKTSGYCGIDESTHAEFVFVPLEDLAAGSTYTFHPIGYSAFAFTPSCNIPSGSRLVWSEQDPASRSYIWDEANDRAYSVSKGAPIYLTDASGAFIVDGNGNFLITSTSFPAEMYVEEHQNWFSFLMDFSYYNQVGLLTDAMLQSVAQYQRYGAAKYKESNEAMSSLLETLQRLTTVVGSVDFCKLNVISVDDQDGYVALNLDDPNVVYRSDYSQKESKRFAWTPAIEINAQGDPSNDVASVIYIVKNSDGQTPTWSKQYVQSFNGTIKKAQDGVDQKSIQQIQLWCDTGAVDIAVDDEFYLFKTNNVNGLLGSWEVADESKVVALEEATKVVTSNHPVYFCEHSQPDASNVLLNGYAWAWRYDSSGHSKSQLYFYFGDGSGNCYGDLGEGQPSWVPVYYSGVVPQGVDGPAYWYNWAEQQNWDSATQYAQVDGQWVKTSNEVVNATWVLDGEDGLHDISYDITNTWTLFGTVYNTCLERDRQYQGFCNYLKYTVADQAPADGGVLSAGNYYFADSYGDYYLFTTKENLSQGSTVAYNAFDGWIEVVASDNTKSIIEVKKSPFDSVRYNNDAKGVIIADKEHYTKLQPVEEVGDHRSIIAFIKEFCKLSDQAYEVDLKKYNTAQNAIKELDQQLADSLGDILREGWWQSSDYIDGDEDKLYDDAYDNLKKVAQPEATYSVSYLDRYGTNPAMMSGVVDVTTEAGYPDISIMSAIHLVDPEININLWAYCDRVKKCYDQPYKTSQEINTNLTTMNQHSFTDVLTNIANVASELKGKTSVFERAEYINPDGTVATDRLEGAIDASRLRIFGGNSTWYTDDIGNMIFVAADNSSAMTLTGNGFAIADSKNESGEWNWRTFGTGRGFTADEIVAGYLSADRIQANSISSAKLDPRTQGLLSWVDGSMMQLTNDAIIGTVTDSQVGDGAANDKWVGYQQSVMTQTANSIRAEFNETLSETQALANNVNAWFEFSGNGLKIGAQTANGTESPFYTKQDNQEYGFYKENVKLASITGQGMSIPQVDVSTQFKLGNLLAIVDENDAIDWVY